MDLTFKDYQKQLRDNVKAICENFTNLLNTRAEHLDFDVSVKSAEIIRSYENLLSLIAEIRTNLIINDTSTTQSHDPNSSDAKLIRLRDELSMFLYELEMHND